MLDCRHTITLSKLTMAPAKAYTHIPMCQEFHCLVKLVATAESQA